MATGKVKRNKYFATAGFSYKDARGIDSKTSKTYTKTNFSFSLPSDASSTFMGIRRFGGAQYSMPYRMNNGSNLLYQHNFQGGFTEGNLNVYFYPVFLSDE